MKYGLPLRERLESAYVVDPETECWLWQRPLTGGCAQIKVDGRSCMAARLIWELHNGPLPAALRVLRVCESESCVNPAHRVVGTIADLRTIASARTTHCPQGHPYDDENTFDAGDGRRRCRACQRERTRSWRLRNKERRAAYAREQYHLPRNREKMRARGMAANAIEHGRIIRQPCEVCGAEPAEAHHDDYSKPLDVRFLCPEHHRAHHYALNNERTVA